MFRGATTINLDSKGRLAIPAKHRHALSIDCEGKMVCTIDIKQPCLLLYPLPEWQIIEKKLTQLSSMNPAERRLQRLLLGHADDCDMDKNGRLLISAPLRQHAGLEKKLMLVGQLNKFEIWDEAAWHDQITQDMDVEREGDFTLNERLEDFSL
ncbi:division/cell wall cluster transcriptional repressor MraZ [Idiomarina seosinensis]|uniref:Transcriptional regulator MraZ n=1 Tax=Idiomarina seosinensis TaxID=281739 RepID=A0A432ZD47_9GAMM|nr:division/cell wall cluster transcriptional repressor MraZ [Idiomarina seosinensis]RUO75893.1 cell division/cell wall cluster transcriptional repressor MraZ [Idiomarina seosinensis]